MKRQAVRAIVLAVIALVLIIVGMLSWDWYTEERDETDRASGERTLSVYGYGLRGVMNNTRVSLNETVLSAEEKVQDYDDFVGLKNSRAGKAVASMNIIMLVALVMVIIFIPLVYLASAGSLEANVGRIGPYIPIIVAQVAALLLIVGPIWFTWTFAHGIDDDHFEMELEPSQALGGMAGWWVIFGGVSIQAAALMALARTRLIYIEPLPGKVT